MRNLFSFLLGRKNENPQKPMRCLNLQCKSANLTPINVMDEGEPREAYRCQDCGCWFWYNPKKKHWEVYSR